MNSYRVTEYYKTLAKKFPVLKRTYFPDVQEEKITPYEVSDPLGEKSHEVSSGLIHRYKDRVLFLVTDTCALYCRHCFRRDFIDQKSATYTEEAIKSAVDYIREHQEVHEIILSGGDPLTLSPQKLDYLLKMFSSIRDNIIIRIGTRVPIVDPFGLSDKILEILGRYKPIYLMLQCNHRYELTNEVRDVIHKLLAQGVILLNQAVLLKGINDSVNELKLLCHGLLEFGIKPYYIFQGDLARGTSHFRVPIDKGLVIMRELRDEVSGIAMPTYAVDIPGGGGKIPLNSDYIDRIDEEFYYLKNSSGFIGKYPRE